MFNLNGPKGLLLLPRKWENEAGGWLRNVLRVGFKTFQAQLKTSKSSESGELSVQIEWERWGWEKFRLRTYAFLWLWMTLNRLKKFRLPIRLTSLHASSSLPEWFYIRIGNLQSISRSVVGFTALALTLGAVGKEWTPLFDTNYPLHTNTHAHTHTYVQCVCVVNAKRIVRFTLFDSYCNSMNIFAAL